MISDDEVKQLSRNSLNKLTKHIVRNKPLPTEFYRGVAWHLWKQQHPDGCTRHLAVFDKFNIIPEYCFDCYKVLIEPRTVMELFKLMIVFDKINLPNDNTRKCIVECREEISGAYKGLIYCRSLEEGNELFKLLQDVVSEEISNKIPVTLKRGCSEYALAYPEYAQTGQGAAAMKYREEWHEYEDLADQELTVITQTPETDTYNRPIGDLQEAPVMLAWLKYAATIGDSSYLEISGRPVHPVPNLKRPSFQPPEDEKNFG